MDNKCRTCARNDQFEGISVNALSETHQESIYLMLIYCTQLQYSPNDTFPQQICRECFTLLDGAFTFWKQCRQTDANLRMLGQLLAAPVQEVPPVLPAVETTPVEASPPPNRFWCCFRKCSKVTKSLSAMEKHTKRDHFTERVANEAQRVPDHEFICPMCCAGFKLLGSYEFHRMTLLGTRQKLCITSLSQEQQQQQQQQLEEEQEKEPMDDLDSGEAIVVKEELELDDWSESKGEEPSIDFEAKEPRIDEGQHESMDETLFEKQGKVLYDMLIIKLAEAFAKSQDHFQIPLTSKEYVTLRERELLLKRFKKTAISRYQKWMRMVVTCDRCQFQTNVSATMQRHIKKFACRKAKLSYALVTYESAVKILVCVPCGYKSSESYYIRRHQRLLGHEGIDISRTEPTSKSDDAAKETSIPMQLDVVSVKDEPYLSEQDEEKFDCTHCCTKIYSDADQERHLASECPVLHSKDGHYTCEHCKVASFPAGNDLKIHVRTKCPALQGKPSLSRQHVSKQCDTKTDNESFTCTNCGTVFTARQNFERHLKLRACFRDPNQCKKCFTTFLDANALKRHRKVGCPALPPSSCEHCGKGFATKRLLRVHKLTDGCGGRRAQVVKPEKGKLQCPYCFVLFSESYNLKRHLELYCVVVLQKEVEAERAAAAQVMNDSEVMEVEASTDTGTKT